MSNEYDELFRDEEVYAELYPSFEKVQAEVINNPNKRKTHEVIDSMCIKHHRHLRRYTSTFASGKPCITVMCPLCRTERKKELWKIKLNGNLEK
jgi:hypothetical protein